MVQRWHSFAHISELLEIKSVLRTNTHTIRTNMLIVGKTSGEKKKRYITLGNHIFQIFKAEEIENINTETSIAVDLKYLQLRLVGYVTEYK